MSEGIRKLFSEIPDTYEIINHIVTFGQDMLWRKKAARRASAAGGRRWIDVCTGTGEMACNLVRLKPENVQVYAVDFCVPMLQRAKKKSYAGKIHFMEADVGLLPFPDNYFDLVTISFATRNIRTSDYRLSRYLAEFHRVLKPGGRFINLETSQPVIPVVRFLFHLYVKTVVRVVGTALSLSFKAYAYLSFTIPRFYSAERFRDILLKAGFAEVRYERMFLGVAAIHDAMKKRCANARSV